MGRKHCGKRRNCLLQAISPFLSVFKTPVSQGRQKVSLCGNGLRKVWLMALKLKNPLQTVISFWFFTACYFMTFSTIFNLWWPVHLSMLSSYSFLPLLYTIFFPSPWLIFHVTMVTTTINPPKKFAMLGTSTNNHLVLSLVHYWLHY